MGHAAVAAVGAFLRCLCAAVCSCVQCEGSGQGGSHRAPAEVKRSRRKTRLQLTMTEEMVWQNGFSFRRSGEALVCSGCKRIWAAGRLRRHGGAGVGVKAMLLSPKNSRVLKVPGLKLFTRSEPTKAARAIQEQFKVKANEADQRLLLFKEEGFRALGNSQNLSCEKLRKAKQRFNLQIGQEMPQQTASCSHRADARATGESVF